MPDDPLAAARAEADALRERIARLEAIATGTTPKEATMTTTPTVRDLLAILGRREKSTAAPYARLRESVEHEEWSSAYRVKLAAQAKGTIAAVNAEARRELAELAAAFAIAPRARIAEGPRLDADALAEVPIMVTQYGGNPKRILPAIDQALAEGATRRAAILARAAVALGAMQPDVLGGDTRWDTLAMSDPEVRDATIALGIVDRIRLVMDADIERERFRMLRGTKEGVDAEIGAKVGAAALGLPPAWAEGEGDSAYGITVGR